MIDLVDDKVDVPDGTYAGLWDSFLIRLAGQQVELSTREGCRSLDGMPVTVVVRGGRATATEGSAARPMTPPGAHAAALGGESDDDTPTGGAAL